MGWSLVDSNYFQSNRECRSRSDRTYVQADLAPHPRQNESMVVKGTERVKNNIDAMDY